ncbi:MAG: NAD-dependent epimerase/dehydratase [Bryobacterales bacterium]|nr:NAD-dependent epimerase/dehydratase [Bryobacterales bacterium]
MTTGARFVVTGGAGFIGSTLVRTLLKRGSVVVIDNLLTGKEANLQEVRGQIEFHNVDIRHAAALEPVIRGADTVFHLAAIPSVPRSIEDPVPSHEVNIDGTFNVLRAAAQGGVRRVVYAASSSGYGDTEVLPKTETMAPLPKSPYAVQKLLGEYYASVFHSCYGLEAVSLRFFNVYGPRQDPTSPYSGVLSLFMKHLLERASPTIFGDGEQSRDFTYVEDVAELCWKASQASGVAGKMYNAGNGNQYTLNRIWKLLQEMEGVDLPARHGPVRGGDVRHSQADTAAAIRDLGHSPRVTIEEGLRRTLEWYRQMEKKAE